MSVKSRKNEFVICAKNGDHPASLELQKLYPVLPDQTAQARRMIRIVDESGEDYLYPEKYFVAVQLEEPALRAVRRAMTADSATLSRTARMG
jgi:hypothetical protein